MEKRGNEEDYFHKQDLELLERMRKASAAERARKELGDRSGLHDPELLKDLEELGFAPDTLKLLPLVPVLHVAWAEGSVSPEERKLILDLARRRDIAEGSAADRQLQEWLAHKPPQHVFTRGGRIIMAMIAAGSPEVQRSVAGRSPEESARASPPRRAESWGWGRCRPRSAPRCRRFRRC